MIFCAASLLLHGRFGNGLTIIGGSEQSGGGGFGEIENCRFLS